MKMNVINLPFAVDSDEDVYVDKEKLSESQISRLENGENILIITKYNSGYSLCELEKEENLYVLYLRSDNLEESDVPKLDPILHYLDSYSSSEYWGGGNFELTFSVLPKYNVKYKLVIISRVDRKRKCYVSSIMNTGIFPKLFSALGNLNDMNDKQN